MGLKFPRKKRRRLWVSVAFGLHRWLRAPARFRARFYLNAHWLFGRLAHEESHRLFSGTTYPRRAGTQQFLARHLPTDAAVLDLGCGNGLLSTWLAQVTRSVVGIDHDEQVIRLAMSQPAASNLEFTKGDASEFIENTDREFDVLILCQVLEHLDDPKALLSRVTPKVRFVYIEAPDFDASAHNLLREHLGLELSYTDVDHIFEFGRAELEDLIREAGLRVIEAERIHGVQRIWCDTTTQGQPAEDGRGSQ